MSLRAASAAVLAFCFWLAASPAAAQQLYQWTDEKGRVHITDTPPPASARNVQRKDAGDAGNVASSEAPADTPYEVAQAMKNFPVTLYTSPTCRDACALARAALNRRGVPFKEIQVWNEQTNEELNKVSGRNDVPTLVVGRSVHVGFEPGAFDSLLDSARYPKSGSVPARAQAAPPPPEGYTAPVPAEPAPPEAEAPPPGPYAPKAPPPGRQ
jgi:glutaredoxin